jgi:DNA-binding HxlR family transcriptional regulator
MVQRSYNQYCPIAHGLDLIGERWTLLIVRDLLLGPKRFSDLRVGLPGIGTNILTDRLKGLEEAGVIRRRVLPPPAASTVYELTPYGQQLDGPIQALAQWGGQTLGLMQPDEVLSRDSILLTLRAWLRQLDLPVEATHWAFRFKDARFNETIGVLTAAGQVTVPHPVAQPDRTIVLDVAGLFAAAGAGLSFAEAIEQSYVLIG